MDNFGYRLKTAIKNAGYTQAKVTSELNLSKNAITNYVNGRIPESAILYKLSKLLNISMEWLLTGEDDIVDNSAPINNKVTSDQQKVISSILKLDPRRLALVEGFVLSQLLEQEKASGAEEMSATSNKNTNNLSSTSGSESSLEPKVG